jgi:RHS repeat-associated protein
MLNAVTMVQPFTNNITKNQFDANDDRIYNENFLLNTNGHHGADLFTEKQYYLRDASGKEMGILNMLNNTWEWDVYGHDRIASIQGTATNYYEYDHLGGVRMTYSVSGVNCSNSPLPAYSINYMADYYAFGKILRSYVPSVLDRRGFDGLEREKRISDNNYYTHFREQDAEIGRWWSVDPKVKNHESPYVSMANNPVSQIDLNGDTPGEYEKTYNNESKAYDSKKVSDKGDKENVNTYNYSGGALNGQTQTYDANTRTSTWQDGSKKQEASTGTNSSAPSLLNTVGPALVTLAQPFEFLKPLGALQSSKGSSLISSGLAKVWPKTSPLLGAAQNKIFNKTASIIGQQAAKQVVGGSSAVIGRVIGRWIGSAATGIGTALTVYDVGRVWFPACKDAYTDYNSQHPISQPGNLIYHLDH